jgi:sigma-70-like protein
MTRETLNQLLQSARPRLQRVLRSFEIPPCDAEDMIQDAQLELIYRWDKIRSPEAWLIGTVKKKCIMYWRKRRSSYDAAILELSPTIVDSQDKVVPLVQDEVKALMQPESPSEETLHADARPILWARASGFFDTISVFIPGRIADEDLGDALEDIHRRLCAGQRSWRIYCKIASTAFWIAINSLREILGALGGKAKASSKH